MRLTPAVALALDAATSPVCCGDLAGKLAAEFPATPPEKINRLIVELVAHGVLISALRAPSTITDPLGHLLAALHAHGSSGLPYLAPLLRDCMRSIPAWRSRTELSPQGRAGLRARP